MQGFLPQRARRPSIDLSPLVDVVFLLIIFFVVSTTFREGTGLPVELPSAGTAAPAPAGPVEITLGPEGEVAVSGRRFRSFREAEPAIRAAIERAEPRRVLLRGDRQAPYEVVIAVLDLARSLEARVTLAARRPAPRRGGDR
ncbi:MAG: biopolymer transporter ExbD [Acidobacteria bacterium]|nr:MAG: biopolymer transporter ExbD [Acidobacteriota bacterium]